MKFILWKGKAVMQAKGKKYFGDFYVSGNSVYFEGKNDIKNEINIQSIEKIEIAGIMPKKLKIICKGGNNYIFILKNAGDVKHLIDSLMKNYRLS